MHLDNFFAVKHAIDGFKMERILKFIYLNPDIARTSLLPNTSRHNNGKILINTFYFLLDI